MEHLQEISHHLVERVNPGFERSFAGKINWDRRLIEITGARGVGKTTMFLQQLKKRYGNDPQKGLYVSLDDPWFYNHSLTDLADDFVKYGGIHLFIDEVHRYPPKHPGMDWSAEVKVIYDRHPEIKIAYTGSSIIELYGGGGDLSRRRSRYSLNGMSFREYLEFNNILKYGEVDLEGIFQRHTEIAGEIKSKVKILKYFKDYLVNGFFPFFNEDPENYHKRILDILAVILESDLPSVTGLQFENILKLKRLLAVISTSAPFVPNLSEVRTNIGITDHRTLLKYLFYLEKAEVIMSLQKEGKGKVLLRKPDKIYLNNTNLIHALAAFRADKGNWRETFFLNQIKTRHSITYPEKGDFSIDGKYIIETGGKHKGFSQIEGMENGWVVSDDIEVGFGRKVPLWVFGFLY
jgi:predicted AAA+ superfamily ATPase